MTREIDSEMSNKIGSSKQILGYYQKLIWPEVESYLQPSKFPSQFEVPKQFEGYVDTHWEIAGEYSQRKGKYIRGALTILTAEAMGGNAMDARKTAAAMQLSQDWILNADDIEDKSILRRGEETLWRMYGIPQAINASDAIHLEQNQALLDNFHTLDQKTALAVANEFSTMLRRTTLGQTIELKLMEGDNFQIDEKLYLLIIDGKSAYYTIAGPMRLGAIIAGASEKQLNALADFGLHLGRAFQIRDDVLDVTSDFQGLKQFANDIYERKRTGLLIHLLNNCTESEKTEVLNVLGKKREKMTEKEVGEIVGLMEKKGSIAYAQNLVQEYFQQAMEIFDNDLEFLSEEPYRSRLLTVCRFIIEREY